MNDTTMPAAEAAVAGTHEDDRSSYEFAFHVLPTVAEGEVASVFSTLKEYITKAGGEITTEEMPERIELAYEIMKPLEGKNRKFSSAYFGWVRFKLDSEAVNGLTATIDADTKLLRYLLTRLTKLEEAHPFFYHEAMKAQKQVENIEVTDSVAVPAAEEAESTDVAEDDDASSETEEKSEESDTVDETELDAALEKKEA